MRRRLEEEDRILDWWPPHGAYLFFYLITWDEDLVNTPCKLKLGSILSGENICISFRSWLIPGFIVKDQIRSTAKKEGGK